MEVLGTVMSWLIVAFFIWMLVTWIWVFYHKIKCRKVENCTNRKCRYWQWCNHNYIERKKDEIEWRKQLLIAHFGMPEESTDGLHQEDSKQNTYHDGGVNESIEEES